MRWKARFLVSLGVGMFGWLGFGRLPVVRPEPTAREMTTQFVYRATVPDVPPGTRVLDLWLPIPADSTWQTVRDLAVRAPGPYRVTRESKFGNRMVYVRVSRPAERVDVSVGFTVWRREVRVLDGVRYADRFDALPAADRRRWEVFLQPDRLVPVGGRWLQLARDVTEGTSTLLQKARAVFEHVVATMQYDYKKESPKLGEGDVAFVCDFKKGNCMDLHSYAVSLLRSLGIPAYVEEGFPVAGIPVADPIPAEGAVGGYHCWIWVYMPGLGWMPMDASDGRRWLDAGRPGVKDYLFGNLVLERSAVALTRGRDITLVPAQKGGPLNAFIYPYAEADGRPVKAEWELRYRLVGAPQGGLPAAR